MSQANLSETADLITPSRLQKMTGMHAETIRKRIARLAPVSNKGQWKYYNTAEAFQAVYSTAPDEGIQDAKRRKESAEADLAEIKRDKARGELIELSAVTWAWERILLPLRQSLEAMPSKVQSQYGLTDEQTQGIEDELYHLLETASNPPAYRELDGLSPSDAEDDDGEPEAEAEAQDKRVGKRAPSPKPGRKRRARKVSK